MRFLNANYFTLNIILFCHIFITIFLKKLYIINILFYIFFTIVFNFFIRIIFLALYTNIIYIESLRNGIF